MKRYSQDYLPKLFGRPAKLKKISLGEDITSETLAALLGESENGSYLLVFEGKPLKVDGNVLTFYDKDDNWARNFVRECFATNARLVQERLLPTKEENSLYQLDEVAGSSSFSLVGPMKKEHAEHIQNLQKTKKTWGYTPNVVQRSDGHYVEMQSDSDHKKAKDIHANLKRGVTESVGLDEAKISDTRKTLEDKGFKHVKQDLQSKVYVNTYEKDGATLHHVKVMGGKGGFAVGSNQTLHPNLDDAITAHRNATNKPMFEAKDDKKEEKKEDTKKSNPFSKKSDDDKDKSDDKPVDKKSKDKDDDKAEKKDNPFAKKGKGDKKGDDKSKDDDKSDDKDDSDAGDKKKNPFGKKDDDKDSKDGKDGEKDKKGKESFDGTTDDDEKIDVGNAKNKINTNPTRADIIAVAEEKLEELSAHVKQRYVDGAKNDLVNTNLDTAIAKAKKTKPAANRDELIKKVMDKTQKRLDGVYKAEKKLAEDAPTMNTSVLVSTEHKGKKSMTRRRKLNIQTPGQISEGDYKPGITVITRALNLDDEKEREAVRAIKWPYGVSVSWNGNEVTFKTAKMLTVAKLLDKAIDFDSISAAEALDLPAELSAQWSHDNSRKTKSGKYKFKEEFGQLDELSKEKLGKYVVASAEDKADQRADRVFHFQRDEKKYKTALRKSKNRDKGIRTAVRKLAKEEVEQIDEISDKLKKRYVDRAVADHGHLQFGANQTQNPREKKDWQASADKRKKGISLALKKLRKDED